MAIAKILKSVQKHRLLVLSIVLGLTSVAVISCSRSDSTDAFAPVNQAVAEIKPAQVGTVIDDKSLGSGGALGQSPTRIVSVLVDKDTVGASAQLQQALSAASFERTSDTLWQRAIGGKAILLFIATRGAGSTTEGLKGPVPAGQTVLILTFNESR